MCNISCVWLTSYLALDGKPFLLLTSHLAIFLIFSKGMREEYVCLDRRLITLFYLITNTYLQLITEILIEIIMSNNLNLKNIPLLPAISFT